MTIRQIILFQTIIFISTIASRQAFGQTEHISFFKQKNYFSVGLGLMFNHPTLTNNNYNINRAFTNDRDLALSWFYFFNKHFGTQTKLDWTTQSVKYKYTDTSGAHRVHESFSYSKSGRYSLTLGLTYNFKASKNINFLLTLGPQFHLNKYTNPFDSTSHKYVGGLVQHNIRQTGFGFYFGLQTNYKINDRLCLFLNASYQRGFVKFREAIVGDINKTSTLNYFGSGPSVLIGVMFGRRQKPATTDE